MKDQSEKVAQWIVQSKRVVVFAGAGLSTESGIPDFEAREACGIDTTRGLLLSELHGQRSLPGKVLADGNRDVRTHEKGPTQSGPPRHCRPREAGEA